MYMSRSRDAFSTWKLGGSPVGGGVIASAVSTSIIDDIGLCVPVHITVTILSIWRQQEIRFCCAPAMKVQTIEVNWHNTRAVFSVDFDPASERLATGGSDRFARVWRLDETPTFLAELGPHGGAVNAVRFSPDGELLATGGDEGSLNLWRRVQSSAPSRPRGNLEEATEGEETWLTVKTFRYALVGRMPACKMHDL